MTIREKFLPFVDWMDLQDDCTDRNWALRNANKCVDVADEFAIDFADWIRVCKLKGRSYDFDNIKELLTIYKEEKGL